MRKEVTAALNQLIPIGWAGQDGKVNTRKGKTEPDPAKHDQYGKSDHEDPAHRHKQRSFPFLQVYRSSISLHFLPGALILRKQEPSDPYTYPDRYGCHYDHNQKRQEPYKMFHSKKLLQRSMKFFLLIYIKRKSLRKISQYSNNQADYSCDYPCSSFVHTAFLLSVGPPPPCGRRQFVGPFRMMLRIMALLENLLCDSISENASIRIRSCSTSWY